VKYLIQHFIEDTFVLCPDRVAIEQGESLYTYAEVNSLARHFEAHLRLRRNDSEHLIGVLSRVRFEAIALMIGALRSGTVYVPLNTLAPSAWIGDIIGKAGIKTLFVESKFLPLAEPLFQWGLRNMVIIDQVEQDNSVNRSALGTGAGEKPRPRSGQESGEGAGDFACPTISQGHDSQSIHYLTLSDIEQTEPVDSYDLVNKPKLADDIAYILYTSGSTGSPKGIMLTHRNAFTFIDWMRLEFGISETDRIFSRAPLQFDLSVFDIFTTFAAGARILIADMQFDNNPYDSVSLLRDKKATVVYTVPSTYINWLSKGGLDRGAPSLRWVLYAGEPFPVPYLRKFMSYLPQTRVSNIYGPTETNIVTYFHIADLPPHMVSVPIGKPVHDTEAYIVDTEMNKAAEGELGEILIRGGTVFAGYFNDPERTRDKLIQSPFHTYPTMCCRTGDIGRVLPDGNIEYHGRQDNMIKTRGYRVEIGEVESALSAIPEVAEMAVIARAHEKYGNTLHAFVTFAGNTLSESEVAARLSKVLPAYMMPYQFLFRDALPKTSTGKVDRVLLKEQLQSLQESSSG
jgi:amino acid adenylation domain-containing protein